MIQRTTRSSVPNAAAIALALVPVPSEDAARTEVRADALRRHLRKTSRGHWSVAVEGDLGALDPAQRRVRLADRSEDVVALVRLADVADPADPKRLDADRLETLLAPLTRHERTGAGVFARRSMIKSASVIGLGVALAACGKSSSNSASPASSNSSGTASGTTGATTGAGATTTAAAASGATVALAPETTEGPYYLDLDLVRSDVREDRQGAQLVLELTVVDAKGKAIKGAAVDIWHCDASGLYSGFVSQSTSAGGGGGATPPSGAGGPGGPGGTPPSGAPGGPGGAPPSGAGGPGGPGGGGAPGGTYTAGNRTVTQGTATDSSKFLRGTQVTDDTGKVTFTTIYPGWYTGRTVHIHTLVNVNDKTVHVGQLFFDDTMSDKIFSSIAPYNAHTGRDTKNSNDSIYQGAAAGGLLDVQTAGSGYKAAVRMAVQTA